MSLGKFLDSWLNITTKLALIAVMWTCVNVTCDNEGTCVDGPDGSSCQCPSGFTGDKCQSGNWQRCTLNKNLNCDLYFTVKQL